MDHLSEVKSELNRIRMEIGDIKEETRQELNSVTNDDLPVGVERVLEDKPLSDEDSLYEVLQGSVVKEQWSLFKLNTDEDTESFDLEHTVNLVLDKALFGRR